MRSAAAHNMLRAALVRSAAAVARPAVLSTSSRRLAVAPVSRHVGPAIFSAPRSAVWMAVRHYAASGGLKKEEVEGRIMELLKGFDKVNDVSNIKPAAHFANDLGLDSLDTVEVVMAIEEEFSIEIPDKDADAIHTVDKAVDYIMSQPDAH